MVGAQISTKELLILIGLIGLTGWYVKRKLTGGVMVVADSIKPIFSRPGEMLYDLLNPKEDPERDIYNISVADNLAINRQIIEAQKGVYDRQDGLH